ncbi:MAG: hypothetical protein LBI79_08045 [Nitrososphaerota archaeon]|jgi:hypothetical protein|nr:hypothetical protein [Nitrososphaerota archaeon]
MYKLALSEIFTCQLDSEACTFLAQYPNMVRWWINRGKESAKSFGAFRGRFYRDWRMDWKGYNSQHAQTSSLVAYSVLSRPNQVQTGEVRGGSFAVVSPRIVKVEDQQLVFSTMLAKRACVRLFPKNSTQRVLLEQAQNECWQIGQSLLTSQWCVIPFTKVFDLASENDPLIQDLLK